MNGGGAEQPRPKVSPQIFSLFKLLFRHLQKKICASFSIFLSPFWKAQSPNVTLPFLTEFKKAQTHQYQIFDKPEIPQLWDLPEFGLTVFFLLPLFLLKRKKYSTGKMLLLLKVAGLKSSWPQWIAPTSYHCIRLFVKEWLIRLTTRYSHFRTSACWQAWFLEDGHVIFLLLAISTKNNNW